MQHQHRAHHAAQVGHGRPHTASPQDVIAAIDRVVACVRADADTGVYSAWAVATLASRLNISAALSASTDPVEVVRDLGDSWATEISTMLTEHPDQTAQVLRAAKAAIERVVEDVKRRGLAG